MQLIDLHCDTIYELNQRGRNETLAENSLAIDLKRMEQANTMLQIFACFINRKEWKTWEEGYKEALRLLDRLEQETMHNQDRIRIARNKKEIEENQYNFADLLSCGRADYWF